MKQTTPKMLKCKLMDLYEEYAEEVIKSRWDYPEDYRIDSTHFWAEIWDMYFSIDTLQRILEYQITKEIVYERYDMVTNSFLSERVKQAIEDTKLEYKDCAFKERNLNQFHRYFLNINQNNNGTNTTSKSKKGLKVSNNAKTPKKNWKGWKAR